MERDPSPQTLQAGTLVGAYRIVRLIARGGMGAVYEAEQATTGARRALKVMRVQLADDEHLFLVMELLEGVTMSRALTVASNATPEGRERNRRVEMWLR